MPRYAAPCIPKHFGLRPKSKTSRETSLAGPPVLPRETRQVETHQRQLLDDPPSHPEEVPDAAGLAEGVHADPDVSSHPEIYRRQRHPALARQVKTRIPAHAPSSKPRPQAAAGGSRERRARTGSVPARRRAAGGSPRLRGVDKESRRRNPPIRSKSPRSTAKLHDQSKPPSVLFGCLLERARSSPRRSLGAAFEHAAAFRAGVEAVRRKAVSHPGCGRQSSSVNTSHAARAHATRRNSDWLPVHAGDLAPSARSDSGSPPGNGRCRPAVRHRKRSTSYPVSRQRLCTPGASRSRQRASDSLRRQVGMMTVKTRRVQTVGGRHSFDPLLLAIFTPHCRGRQSLSV